MEKIKNCIFNFLERVLPYSIYKYIRIVYRRVTTKGKTCKWIDEYIYKWRPFAKKKYYIVRFPKGYFDLFAAARTYIFVAEYVASKGMHPLIDIEEKTDFEKGILGWDNMWDLAFEQEKIEDILKENATILVGGVYETDLALPETCIDINNDPMDHYIHAEGTNWEEYYRNIYKYVKKYWKANAIMRGKENRLEAFCKEEKILGVSLRENFSEEFVALLKSDGAKNVYRRHPLGPDVSEIVEIVKDCLRKWNCTKIFLATMYEDSIERFEKEFPGRIIYIERERFIMSEKAKLSDKGWAGADLWIDDAEKKKKNVRQTAYAKETFLLSQCSYFIGAKSGGTIAALMLNGGRYEDVIILEDKRHVKRY